MSTLLYLTMQSAKARKLTLGLAMLSITVSVMLVLTVERLRADARASFTNTLTGADLLVGTRGSPLNLLLYSIFRLGDATANVSWESYEHIEALKDVRWTIPLALGDAHRGYRVLGTNQNYFEHYRFADNQPLTLQQGRRFDGPDETVLGAETAEQLGYALGDEIILSHGIGAVSFEQHSDQPLTIVGIFERTGTPVDRTVHVSLETIAALHDEDGHNLRHDHENNRQQSGDEEPESAGHEQDDHDEHGDQENHEDHGVHEEQEDHDEHGDQENREDHGVHEEQEDHDEQEHEDHADHGAEVTLSAVIIGLQNRSAALRVQRQLNEYDREPLLATIPGVALAQLWSLLSVAEQALFAVSGCVLFAGLIGLLTTLLSGLAQRRRELTILRALGASPATVFALLLLEAGLLGLLAALIGILMTYLAMLGLKPWLLEQFGFALAAGVPGGFDLALLGAVTVGSLLVAVIPAWRLYRYALADGLTLRY